MLLRSFHAALARLSLYPWLSRVVLRGGQSSVGGLVLAACVSACGAGAQGAPAQGPGDRPALPRNIVAKSAHPIYALVGAQTIEAPALWEQLATSRVICFGEQHDNPAHHYAQQRALTELAARAASTQRTLAVGFEMFQRPYQSVLTTFVAGGLTEEQFLTESDYAERWGFDFSLYRPLLKAVREYSLEALAMNAPRELARKISRQGLEGLEAGERSQLPELDLENKDHRSYFEAAMGDHPMPEGAPTLANMYAAQVLWDETMAESAASWLEHAGPSAQLIMFAGNGHCHRTAVPSRITRRTTVPVLSVSPVLASELGEYKERGRYDWLVILDDEGGGKKR